MWGDDLGMPVDYINRDRSDQHPASPCSNYSGLHFYHHPQAHPKFLTPQKPLDIIKLWKSVLCNEVPSPVPSKQESASFSYSNFTHWWWLTSSHSVTCTKAFHEYHSRVGYSFHLFSLLNHDSFPWDCAYHTEYYLYTSVGKTCQFFLLR